MMTCPNCGSFYEEGDHYCSACGIALSAPQVSRPRRKHAIWPPVLILLVMVAIGLTVYFVVPSAPEPSEPAQEYPWFQMEGGTLYFVEELYTGESDLVIPETVDGQTVTILGEDSFAYCTTLTTVFLPDTVTEIRDGAFRECTSLRGMLIPESVVYLGDEVFENCKSMEAICIASSSTFFGFNVFDSCQSLRYIFFNGYSEEWTSRYGEFITPYTYVVCQDGIIPQGGNLP